MLNRLKALLDPSKSGEPQTGTAGVIDDLHLACAALLVEAALMDGQFDEGERQTIGSLLTSHFGLEPAEAEELIEAGHEAVSKSVQLFGFAKVIKDRYEEAERIKIIEMLWQVAYADGELHDYESNLVRRISGLLYVADRESGEARKRVLAKLGPKG